MVGSTSDPHRLSVRDPTLKRNLSEGPTLYCNSMQCCLGVGAGFRSPLLLCFGIALAEWTPSCGTICPMTPVLSRISFAVADWQNILKFGSRVRTDGRFSRKNWGRPQIFGVDPKKDSCLEFPSLSKMTKLHGCTLQKLLTSQ